jgi:TolB-like protein/tetratricopeptide (TPR) repeat protein
MAGGAEEGTEAKPATGPTAVADGRIFISYASKNAAVANAVVETLERNGIKCWIAPRDVVAGEFYADAIVRAIDAAPALVLILSQDAAASHHILREVERATSKRHPVISLRIDNAPIHPGLEYFLNPSQWLDAADGDPSRAFPKLVEAVRRALTGAPVSAASDPHATHDPGEPAPRFTRRTIALVAGLITVALAALAIDRAWLSTHAESADHTAIISAPTQTPIPATIAATIFTPPPHSIAVLPFVNMSGDPKQEYFSDGITEELLNSLSRLNELQVVARTSSFSFKGQNVDVSTIAHKLNVGTVLEGSVRRAGSTVRITVQLINAVSGFHIWSQTYDRNFTDILKIQTDVATSVAQVLEGKLVGDAPAKIELGGTKNPVAYDDYLRGTQLLKRGDTDDAGDRAAMAAFDQAIALDPNYALAYSGRAAAIANFSIFNAKPAERAQLREQAREAAERAVALAPDLGQVHLIVAQIRAFLLLDYAGAAPELDRALALMPGSASVQEAFAGFSAQLGHFAAAEKAARRAVSLDPLDVGSHIVLGHVFYYARRYNDALAALQDADARSPRSRYIQGLVTLTLLASGQTQQTQQQCELPSTLLDEDFRHHCLAVVYHVLGRQVDAERELRRLEAIHGDGSAYGFAEIYAQWGDRAESLRWLTAAERLRSPGLQAIRVDWELDPIRSDPQFKTIEARMNLPP